ncbi:unnamed protein product [Rhodiola kirilowii]
MRSPVLWLMLLSACCWGSLFADAANIHVKQRANRTMPVQLMMSRIGSSVLFPVYGNVYPKGFYYVPVNIGQPPKPYFLDLDTGSDLTWVQCDAPCISCTRAYHPPYMPSDNLVKCKDPLCAALHSPGPHRCEDPDQCDYEVEYADGGSSLGVLVKEAVHLNLTEGNRISPQVAIGCGYDQMPGLSDHYLDGVLGLGRGKISIVSQLQSQGLVKNVVGHCLSSRGGGYLFFGDSLYDPARVTWTPMSSEYTNHYSPGYADLLLGDRTPASRDQLVIFDSGSSYSYLKAQPYQALVSWLRKELSGRSLRESKEDQTLPLCWKGKKPFKSLLDVKKYFKSFALSFVDDGWREKTKFEFTPESYLVISLKGSVCLGILNGTEVGVDNIIGDISMQDKMVIYDNNKQVIGWMPANCDRVPKSRYVHM